MLPRDHRLSRTADFERLFSAGKPLRHQLCTLRAERNNLTLTRVGIVCGKRVGGAVIRNRAKRQLREAMRPRLASVEPGWDILLVIQPAGAQASAGDFSCALDELLRRRELIPQARRT
ncbi:MAG: ribonuclease P protein component [Chloroflexi bacterium]|nr:ribonuclease P protein component [Chloroflexota bacterium]